VLIPKDYVDTILYAKESQLSFKAHILELFQTNYTSKEMALGKLYDLIVKLVGKDVTKLLHSPSVVEALSNEARNCLLESWGQDTENWVEVPLNSSMERMNGRLINLLAVGPEICKYTWWFSPSYFLLLLLTLNEQVVTRFSWTLLSTVLMSLLSDHLLPNWLQSFFTRKLFVKILKLLLLLTCKQGSLVL
jgi:hypothetical protein